MEQRAVLKSGMETSLLGLGCNNFCDRSDKDASRAVIHKALDVGITVLTPDPFLF